jgi:hypothetical protein
MFDQQIAAARCIAQQRPHLVLCIGVKLSSLGMGESTPASTRMGMPLNAPAILS